jgi:hypothetical protein
MSDREDVLTTCAHPVVTQSAIVTYWYVQAKDRWTLTFVISYEEKT